jgi:hypothetical protein
MSQKLRDACTAIGAAYSEEQVVATVRLYVATLTPDEAAAMPKALKVLGLGRPESLVQAALHMVKHELNVALDVAEHARVSEAVVVLATATRRLALLNAFYTTGASWEAEQRLQ